MQNAVPSEATLFATTPGAGAVKGSAAQKGQSSPQDGADSWEDVFTALKAAAELTAAETQKAQPPAPQESKEPLPETKVEVEVETVEVEIKVEAETEVERPNAESPPMPHAGNLGKSTFSLRNEEATETDEPDLQATASEPAKADMAVSQPVMAETPSLVSAPEAMPRQIAEAQVSPLRTPEFKDNETTKAAMLSSVPEEFDQAKAVPLSRNAAPIDSGMRQSVETVPALPSQQGSTIAPQPPVAEAITPAQPDAEAAHEPKPQPAALLPATAEPAKPALTATVAPTGTQEIDKPQKATATISAPQNNVDVPVKVGAQTPQRQEAAIQYATAPTVAAPVMAKAVAERVAPSAAISMKSLLKIQANEAEKAPSPRARLQAESALAAAPNTPALSSPQPSPIQALAGATFISAPRITAVESAAITPVSDAFLDPSIGPGETRLGLPSPIQTTHSLPPAPPNQAQQIAAQIAEVSRPLPDGPVELTLKPEELGRLKLSFSGTETGVVVTITAERPETLDLMRRNIDMLAQEMKRLGHEAAQFNFAGGDTAKGRNQGNAQSSQTTRIALDDVSLPQISQSAPTSAIRLGADGLDLRL